MASKMVSASTASTSEPMNAAEMAHQQFRSCQALPQKPPASIDPASGSLSMVVFGTSFHARRRLPAGINHPDKPHHPLVLMTQDVAVKHELAGNVLVEAHEQAHLAGRHRIIRRPVCVR